MTRSITSEVGAALSMGRPVVLLDGRGGGLIFAGHQVTSASVAFAVRHGSGLLRVVMSDQRATALQLPSMWRGEAAGPASMLAVSVDAAEGITTGISAADRAVTIRLLADPGTTPEQLRRPGHVLPVRAADGCIGYPSAVLDVLRAAEMPAVGAFTEVVGDGDGEPLDRAQLRRFAERHALPVVLSHAPQALAGNTLGPGWLLTNDQVA